MRRHITRWLALFFLVGGLFLGISHPPAFALTDEHQLLSEVWRLVSHAYLDDTFNDQNWWFVRQRMLKRPLSDRSDTYQAIQEMLASLDDPYTRLLPPEQYRSLQTSTSGELTGVGLQIAKHDKDGSLLVVAPVEGSPAEAAGIQPRDRIVAIDGEPTAGLTLDEAANAMRGTVGTTVTLTIMRDDEARKAITLTRDRISLNPVYAQLKVTPAGSAIGYLRLSQFNANAADEVADSIRQFEAQGVDGYILDLRNNPGGLLTAGIEIARLWLDQGTIVYTANRQGIFDSFMANGTALTQAPLVVLVNRGTASASEILAGALQDNQRAQLVGEFTFGKGLIQSLFDLSDGAGLAVTVAKYETPDHRDINDAGIRPDHIVPSTVHARNQLATEADAQYQTAVDLLTASAVVAGVP